MVTTENSPKEIKATIHEEAIQKVSRFFNATTAVCLGELLQNARRSGAAKVEITLHDGLITVTDDGRGVQDPQSLLAFGLSQWDEDTARREDPAGMGVYSLARKKDVTIRSRTKDQPQGWQVTLEEQHFTGHRAAPITPVQEHIPQGTSVSFRDALPSIQAIEQAARYYPLPVTLNGEPVKQTDFLENCPYSEEWQGLRIGVRIHTMHHLYPRRINFHGITLDDNSIPTVQSINHEWTAFVDVVDCPQLEPTLPTRNELVQTDFLKELTQACRAAIYRAMLASQDHIDVSTSTQRQAAALGITLPDSRPMLRPWAPEEADEESETNRISSMGRCQVTAGQAAIIDLDMDPQDQQALARALELNANTFPHVVYESDSRMQGYAWYDNLPLITNATFSFTNNDSTRMSLTEARKDQAAVTDRRPRSITATLEFADEHHPAHRMELETDVLFISENLWWTPETDTPCVTASSNITPNELTELMEKAFFSRSDTSDDGYNTQKEEAWAYFKNLATSILVSRKEAVRNSLRKAVQDHILYEVPTGWDAAISITGNRNISVQVTPPKTEESV